MASKKPKGLTITRKNGKYIFKWKKGETYADGERLIWGYVQVTTSGNKSTKTRWESDTVKLSGSKTDYTVNVPVTYTDIAYVYFKVRGKANGEAWSDWESETFKLKDPKEPSVSASWDSGTPNKTSFSFTAQDEDHQPYNHIEWQTILVENCPSDYKAASLWKGATKHTKSGTSGTFYNTPESALTGSWARIVRVRSIGQGGASDWRYAWHVYASPNAPYNVVVDAEYDATNQATDLTVKWDAMAPAMQRPIDTTKVQYCIGVPTAGFGLPTGASWTDVATPVNTALNVWETRLGAEIGLDECLFIRVVTVHDTHEVGSTFVCAYKRELTAPVLGTITPTKSTHTIAVAVTNGSQNPDSKTAITYRDPATGKVGVVGVIAHGGTSMNVLVPAWEDSAGTIGAFVFVGDSSQQKSTPYYVYSVNSLVESDTVWAMATRTAPTITAVIKDETTVNVAWNWPWADATNAELSWADRPDAWESTNQPTTYVVNNNQQASWNITGLDEGKVYYFRVRLFYGENDENFYSDYSNTAVVDMTQPPEKPVLELSDTIVPVDGTITASWQNYEKQTYAELIETVSGVDTVRAEVASGSSVEFSPADFGWSNDSDHILSVKVYLDGTGSLKSDTVAVNVASALECVIAQDSLVYEEQELNPETYTGNPATFDGGDFSKDVGSLQVTLTPKQAGTPWQDSTLNTVPYNFKASPQLSHSYNSEYDTLVGASVCWNQWATGNMWAANGTGTTTDGVMSITASGGVNAYVLAGAGAPEANHVFLLACDVKLDANNSGNYDTIILHTTWSSGGYKGVYAPTKGTWGRVNTIIKPSAVGSNLNIYVFGTQTTPSGEKAQVKNPQVFDLTQMFANDPSIADYIYTLETAHAGDGVAFFKKYFPNSYYAYCTPHMESVYAVNHEMVGFNQCNETPTVGWFWNVVNGDTVLEKNRGTDFAAVENTIKCTPNTQYTIEFPNRNVTALRVYLRGFDGNGNFVSSVYEDTPSTTAKYITLTTGDNWQSFVVTFYSYQGTFTASMFDNFCVHFHYDGERDGEYEPHKKTTYPFGEVELRGLYKLVNGQLQADGDKYESDGTVTRKYGIVDMGTMAWVYHDTNTFRADISDKKNALSADAIDNMICSKYATVTGNNVILKEVNKGIGASIANGRVFVYDTDYSDAAAFKTALSGVYLIYELATPTTTTSDPYQNPQTVDNWGTEYYEDGKVTAGDRDVAIPVGHETRYADVYPISGEDQVDVHVRGVNQFDKSTTGEGYVSDATGAVNATAGYEHTDYIPVIPNATYYGKTEQTNAYWGAWYDADKNYLSACTGWGNNTTTAPAKARYVRLTIKSPQGGNKDTFSFNYPSTDHDYHAYQGSDTTTTLPQTVYSGVVDVVKGTATLDMASIESYNGETINEPWLSSLDPYVAGTTPTIGAQVVYTLDTPITISLTPQEINALVGDNVVWSEQGNVTVRVADAIEDGYILDELPLTVTVTGAGTAGNTTMKIVRAENYAMERPDGKDYNGYEGDLIVQKVQSGEDQMTVDLTNLVGRFDDGAKYRIVATIQDELGQRSEAVKDFTVHWSHQAVIATGTAVIDGDIAKITPTKPNGASDDDYVDVYRLSCDAPELIYSHADFGDTVVDPYPTLGDTGGYRLVLRTKNGDYITEDNLPSWVDVKAGLTTQYQYIDFDGERLPLKYNVKLDETKQKTFDVTHYLGGSVQGDFLEGTEGSGTVNGTIPYMLDPADFITLRDLMRYTGLCHVRTKIGSNYVANVEVQDGSSHDGPGGMHDASLAITQVDNPELDGVLLTDWQVS